jgi:hypothetical protein
MSAFTPDTPPPRATGLCHRCQRHTDNGVRYTVDQGTRAGGDVLLCADTKACDQRRTSHG